MIRYVGYRQDSVKRDLIFEGINDDKWAGTVTSHGNTGTDAPVFFLIDFSAGTATITDTGTGRTDAVSIDTLTVRMDYLGIVIKEMDAELDALINAHGVTHTP